MPTPMSRRRDESLWYARAARRTRFEQHVGSSDSAQDKVARDLLRRGLLASSSQERRALDHYLASVTGIQNLDVKIKGAAADIVARGEA